MKPETILVTHMRDVSERVPCSGHRQHAFMLFCMQRTNVVQVHAQRPPGHVAIPQALRRPHVLAGLDCSWQTSSALPAAQRSRQGVRTSLVSPPPLAPPSLLSSLPPLCRPAVWIAHMAGTPCPQKVLVSDPILSAAHNTHSTMDLSPGHGSAAIRPSTYTSLLIPSAVPPGLSSLRQALHGLTVYSAHSPACILRAWPGAHQTSDVAGLCAARSASCPKQRLADDGPGRAAA